MKTRGFLLMSGLFLVLGVELMASSLSSNATKSEMDFEYASATESTKETGAIMYFKNGIITFSFANVSGNLVVFSIVNSAGEVIYTERGRKAGIFHNRLMTSYLSSGSYTAVLKSGETTYENKFVIE